MIRKIKKKIIVYLMISMICIAFAVISTAQSIPNCCLGDDDSPGETIDMKSIDLEPLGRPPNIGTFKKSFVVPGLLLIAIL